MHVYFGAIPMVKRYYIIYQGQVQGVGFRWRLSMLAKTFNLTGYCRNLNNGNVEVEIQGNDVDEFLKQSLEQDYYIVIDDYAIKQIDLVNNETTFSIKY